MYRRRYADPASRGARLEPAWVGQTMRESVTAEVPPRTSRSARADIREIYRRDPVPTLVCVRPRQPARSAEIALASLVPDCRMAVTANTRWPARSSSSWSRCRAGQRLARSFSRRRGTATILFTDLVDHTEMMQRLGDEEGREVLREHERITRDVLRRTAAPK